MESQKILIIDDNNENIKVAANIIKADNNIVWATLNVKEGIKIAEMKSPDLILLDVQMPIMDGYEACRILKAKEETKDIPIIFITARTDDESIHKAYKAGAVDYITKPIKKLELLARVHTQLKLSSMIKKLKEASVTDGLTQLYNHKKILELLELEIDRTNRYKRTVTIMMLDIDHFKRVNDQYGHVVGDRVLERLALELKRQIRDLDMVGRYGGEEFLIIFPEINKSQAYQVAERLRKTIESLSFDSGLTITISGGLAEFSDEKTEHLVKKADDNLYKAKNTGRNRIVY